MPLKDDISDVLNFGQKLGKEEKTILNQHSQICEIGCAY